MTGLSPAVEGVSDSAPWSEIVFDLCPVPAAFTAYESARLHGFNAIEAHQMEFTFVADCLYGLRSIPTPPRRDAVTVPSRLNSVIAGARLPPACHGFHGRTHKCRRCYTYVTSASADQSNGFVKRCFAFRLRLRSRIFVDQSHINP